MLQLIAPNKQQLQTAESILGTKPPPFRVGFELRGNWTTCLIRDKKGQLFSGVSKLNMKDVGVKLVKKLTKKGERITVRQITSLPDLSIGQKQAFYKAVLNLAGKEEKCAVGEFKLSNYIEKKKIQLLSMLEQAAQELKVETKKESKKSKKHK